MIKVVFIDIDNTLLDFDKCSKASMTSALEEYNTEYNDDIFMTFKEVNDLLWHKIEERTLTKEELHNIRWKMVFEKLDIPLDGPEFEKRYVHYMHRSALPVKGANELLEFLYSKFTICAASNASHRQQVMRLGKSGMLNYISRIFTSETMGYPKPSKEFFDKCFESLENVAPHETIMIGDSINADIRGGAEYGMKTCWFNYYGDPAPSDVRIDYIVSSLSEIKGILG